MKAIADDAFVAPELQPFVEQWGRYAPPAAEAQAITFDQYMAWTHEECNKAERTLAFLLRAVGLLNAVRLASPEEWHQAVDRVMAEG